MSDRGARRKHHKSHRRHHKSRSRHRLELLEACLRALSRRLHKEFALGDKVAIDQAGDPHSNALEEFENVVDGCIDKHRAQRELTDKIRYDFHAARSELERLRSAPFPLAEM